LIEINSISVNFDEKIVLDSVSCQIYKGKITSVIGKSGMGKSVLMKAVLGLLPFSNGEIYIDNLSVKKDIKSIRKKMAILFQNAALFDSLDVLQNVSFPLYEHTKIPFNKIKDKVVAMLELVNLDSSILSSYPSELSGGMRKRVALARAIIQEPEYLIYDEPTTGLDPVTGNDIINLIGSIHRKLGMTSIVITHDSECIKILSESLIMIDNAQIIFNDLFDNFKGCEHPIAQAFVSHIYSNVVEA
jgi:phospholipid/cholesterol/gamma-HCH transport system ATP-binding protein